MNSISVVVPIYNEEGNVEKLHKEIKDVCENEHFDYEIIFIDDGSRDKTVEIAKTLSPLKLIQMRKNFGQTAAMDAGIKAATKDLIVTMDGDLQNDPSDIPHMIEYLEEHNLDIVSGWRKNRKDTFMKRFTSRGANLLRHIIVKDSIHDSGCSLKVYRRDCFEGINLYGEMHRFIPAFLMIKGFTVGEVVVNHRPRTSGVTKYNWKRTFKGFVDMIGVWFWHKYAVRPLHLLGSAGIVSIFVGCAFGVWSVVIKLFGGNLSSYMQPLLAVLFLITGLMMFIFGLMSDMLMRIYYGNEIGSSYNIKAITENEE